MAIYLGATQISSNPTGTGKLILGTQNICKAYLGSTLIFDNCAVANTNVQLQYTGSYGGNATGVIVENPVNNHVISGQPGDTGTLTLSTPTYPASGYNCTGGCPDVNPKSIAYTFPTSGTTTINSARSGGLNSNVPNGTVNLTVTINGNAAGVNYSVSPVSQSIMQAVNTTAIFTINYSVKSNYSGSITDPGGGSSGSYTHNVTVAAGTNPTEVILTANNVTENTYTLNAGTFSYSGVTGGSVNSAFTAATLSPSSETKASGATYTFTQGGLVEASQYSWTSGPTVAYTINGSSAGNTPTGTMQPSYDGQSINGAVTGTLTLQTNNVAVTGYGQGLSCANDACINASGGSQALHFQGSLPANVFIDSGLSTQAADGYYKAGSSAFVVSSGVGNYATCTSPLYMFSYTNFAGSKSSACSGPLSDTFYGDGGQLSTSNQIFNGNSGCAGPGVGWVSDGNNAVQLSAGSNVISTQSC